MKPFPFWENLHGKTHLLLFLEIMLLPKSSNGCQGNGNKQEWENHKILQTKWITGRMLKLIHGHAVVIFALLIKTHIDTTTSHFSVSFPGRVRTLPSRKRQTRPKDVEGKFSLCLELSAWCVWAPRAQQEEGQQRLQGVQDDAQHAAAETQERWRVHLQRVRAI